MDPATLRRRNRLMGLGMAGFVAGMVGMAFAAVPLYRIFCQATGYNGTPMIGQAAPGGGSGQVLTIRFNANTQPDLPWRFEPVQPSVQVQLGEEGVAFYQARNLADRPATGVSTYNVTPEVVGKYFHKTACFCFEQQTLEPGRQVEMPLSFWIDPRIAADPNTSGIRTVTISYSFFRSLEDAGRSGALAAAAPHAGAGAAR